MKYSLIFAATAAAYDAYGGYGEEFKSSSSVKPIGYTTVFPGYGKDPVTVTTQHQPYPTCVSAGYGAKNCDKWEEDAYVSTVIKDYNKKDVTITKTYEPVTVYHTKKTITHSATGKYNGYATPTGGYAAPTGSAYKNGTEGCWYELYEKIEEAPYNKLGPHALPGYPGSGLYKDGYEKQPVHVKEYKGGKWSEYDHEYSYGVPEDEVKTYEKPGVYTVPAKDVTVKAGYPVTYPAEATKTAKAGETCTYGGQYIDAKETGYVTAAYGAYETKVYGSETVTETVVKYTTIYVTKTGHYEISKPTTAVYDHDTEVAYPTAKYYEPGVYHHDAVTVTVTKSNEPYTCKYEQTKKYEPTHTPKGGKDYPAYPTSTPVYDDSYGYKPSATPKKPTEDDKEYPTYPVKGNSTYGHDSNPYPTATPVAVYSKPSYDGEYGYGKDAKSTPVAVYSKPYDSKATPVYDDKDYPAKASSTPCDEDKKPYPTPVKPSVYDPEAYGHPAPTPAKPSVYDPEAYGHPTPTPVKPTPATGYGKRDSLAERRKRVAL